MASEPKAIATAHRVTATPWGEETDAVTTRRASTLVRSEAYDTGWQAQVRDTVTGRTRTLPVIRLGLIQGVRLPAGSYTVTWTYRPTSVTAGLLGTGAGAVAVIAAGASWCWRRRRDRLSAPARRRATCANSRGATRA
jgi:hypothetical protein